MKTIWIQNIYVKKYSMEKCLNQKKNIFWTKHLFRLRSFQISGVKKEKFGLAISVSVISVVSKVGHISRGPMFPGKIGPAQILCLSMLHSNFPFSGLCRIMQWNHVSFFRKSNQVKICEQNEGCPGNVYPCIWRS